MIRLGIIGCGNMTGQHLNSFELLKDKLHVSVVCDLNAERAERAMEILNADRFDTDYRSILSDVDAVLIALPHQLHYPVGKFFIENKKHVLMEKPLCVKEWQCLELTKLAEEQGVTLMTAYPVRFWEETRKMKEYMESGIIGDVFQMTIYTDHYNPSRDTRGTWMSCSGLGGGQMFSHGCHYIDIMLWFLGNPVVGTHLGTNRGTPWMDREGTSHAAIRFENGVIGYHTGTWGARGTTNSYKMEIYGTNGTLSYTTVGENKGKILLLRTLEYSDEKRRNEVLWQKDDASGKRTEGELGHFVSCIMNGETPITNGRTSVTGLRVIWKMYEAEMEGRNADLRGLGFSQPFIDTPICSFDCDSEEAISDYKDLKERSL